MSIENNIIELGKRAKSASLNMKVCSSDQKNLALTKLTKNLDKNRNKILEANKIDLENGEKKSLAKPLINRLTLTEKSIDGLITSIEDIIEIPDPIGITLEEWERPNGLQFRKISTPLGVLGVIYESRPNVTVDASCLSIKSGNCIILRGGSDSFHSSKELVNNITNAFTEAGLPEHCVQMINTPEREAVDHLLSMRDYVDVIIPRGGKGLIEKINSVSKIPVIKHLDGICHVYVDKDADLNMAKKVVLNSKMRRTSICGAAETLLIHDKCLRSHSLPIIRELILKGCEVLVDKKINKYFNNKLKLADESDWRTEYLSPKISIKSVNGVNEAIKHILKYGTMHTDAIITRNTKTANIFLNGINSSIAVHNASTQFADGGEFGFGGEVGISTNTLPPRGPVGLNQLISYKYQVTSKGQIRK